MSLDNKVIQVVVDNNDEFGYLDRLATEFPTTNDFKSELVDYMLDLYNRYKSQDGDYKARLKALQETTIYALKEHSLYMKDKEVWSERE